MKQVDAGPPNSSRTPASAAASSPSAVSNAPASSPACGRCQRPIGATCRVSCQLNRALQEGRRSRDPTTGRGPIGGLLELHRDGLIGFHRGRREMPRTTIGIDLLRRLPPRGPRALLAAPPHSPPGTRPTARADGGTSCAYPPRANRRFQPPGPLQASHPAAPPHATPVRGRRPARPPLPAAAAGSLPTTPRSASGSFARCARAARQAAAGRARPPSGWR